MRYHHPVFLREAEKVVKDLDLPGVTESSIGIHAEIALLALALIELLGASRWRSFFFQVRLLPQWYVALLLILLFSRYRGTAAWGGRSGARSGAAVRR
jgi:hypothetical protein